MAAMTRARVSSRTISGALSTLDTVCLDTFACLATVAIVTFDGMRPRLLGLIVQGALRHHWIVQVNGVFRRIPPHAGVVKYEKPHCNQPGRRGVTQPQVAIRESPASTDSVRCGSGTVALRHSPITATSRRGGGPTRSTPQRSAAARRNCSTPQRGGSRKAPSCFGAAAWGGRPTGLT